jgi:hypothetical protein
MQVFRELFIRGEPEQLKATAEAICNSLSGDWSRNTKAEEGMRELTFDGEADPYCFTCNNSGHRPAATLFLTEKDKKTYYVANIIPHESHKLSYAEYNGIMEEFFKQFVQPAVARTGARAEMNGPEADLEQWLSLATAKKLRLFCSHANKRTGSSHPADRRLWNDFIVSAHREGTNLDSNTLARWLHEAGDWDEGWANELAGEYAFARELLAQANKQSVGV